MWFCIKHLESTYFPNICIEIHFMLPWHVDSIHAQYYKKKTNKNQIMKFKKTSSIKKVWRKETLWSMDTTYHHKAKMETSYLHEWEEFLHALSRLTSKKTWYRFQNDYINTKGGKPLRASQMDREHQGS